MGIILMRKGRSALRRMKGGELNNEEGVSGFSSTVGLVEEL